MQNKKVIILIIFALLAVFVWWPKGKRRPVGLKRQPEISLAKARAKVGPAKIASTRKKRSGFTEWGRNPFEWSKEGQSPVADLQLSGIIWDQQDAYAIINGEIVHAGDEIGDKAIKRIEPNRVIVTDGVADYHLELE